MRNTLLQYRVSIYATLRTSTALIVWNNVQLPACYVLLLDLRSNLVIQRWLKSY